MNKKIAQSHHW